MAFFSGEYECKLDNKSRLVLPARIKSALPESDGNILMLRMSFEPCLVLYPMVEFRKIYSKISSLNEFNEEFRKLQRNFFRENTEVELDSMGRLLIPKKMMLYASLDKDAVVVGLGNRIEIWNPESYEQFLIKDKQELSNLAQKYLND